MRKIDQVAQKQFGGDVEAAIEFLLTGDHGDVKYIFDQYVDELSYEEAKFAMRIIRRETRKALRDKTFREVVRMGRLLDKMGMTHEQILTTDKNPYTRDFVKYVSVSIGIVLFLLTCMFLIPKSDAMLMAVRIATYFWVVAMLTRTLPLFFRWRGFYTAKRLAKKHEDILLEQKQQIEGTKTD